MAVKTISLTESEWTTILIALGNAMCARQALIKKCVTAAESGVESVYTQQEWLELAQKAKQEEAEFLQLRVHLLKKLYR